VGDVEHRAWAQERVAGLLGEGVEAGSRRGDQRAGGRVAVAGDVARRRAPGGVAGELRLALDEQHVTLARQLRGHRDPGDPSPDDDGPVCEHFPTL
jgi:hypothetical protein